MSKHVTKCSVPDGTRGPWRVERFEVSEQDAKFAGFRAIISGGGRGALQPGIYTKLVHEHRGIVMSDTPDEMRDHSVAVRKARDHVLVNGLGLGLVVAEILARPVVTKLTVVEIDQNVIDLVAPHLTDPRLEIVKNSAYDYRPPKGVRYGAVWHDIWDDLCGDNLPEMTKLKRKYGRRADWQGCWGEHFTRRQMGR